MANAKQLLQDIIDNFSISKFEDFFREKTYFSYLDINKREFKQYEDEDFKDSLNIGYIKYSNTTKVLVCAFKSTKELTEKSAKKNQYEKAKKILSEYNNYKAGIFIFYSSNGNFRFSLIYPHYAEQKRRFNDFRRFTYFVSRDFTNKTFLNQIGEKDFTTYENLQEAFSVEKVSKEFYKKLQDWYFWAVKNVSFPNDISTTEDNEQYNNENVIRLITRIIFVWFLKHKSLIPTELFDTKYLKDNVLKSFDPLSKTQNNYYRAILQNLFFATLNKQINERGFALNEDSIKTLYRYGNEFKICHDEILKLYSTIPFLNGGLFECLDNKKVKDEKNEIEKIYYWDGFSEYTDKQANIPNYLFFAEDQRTDLSKEYNDKIEVSGLINILKQFNFTIDENSIDDTEIALDPELLGKVFENLLGAYNPETKETARKESGSFYTPREIVNYMVNESLINYLLNKIPELENIKDDLRILVTSQKEIPETIRTNENIKERIINSLFDCKILDPACGSGAFPVGILQQMVKILNKLDEDNKYWYKKVIDNLKFKSDNNSLTKDEVKQLKQDIDTNFDKNINSPNYARKLYLIENCIYGVDIQSIAIQISRLRLFISLICEQDINKDNKENNYNIRPLPNLESNFVCANTLIGLQQKEGKKIEFFNMDIIQQNNSISSLIDKLKDNRHKLFSVVSYSKKKELIDKETQLKEELKLKIESFCKEKQKQDIDWLEGQLLKQKQELKRLEQHPETVEVKIDTDLFGEEIKRELNLFAKNKEKIQWIIKKVENDIRQLKEQDIKEDTKIAKKLIDWNPYDQNTSSEFFEPDWMFGFYREKKGGFDIVIGNPPYIPYKKISKYYNLSSFESFNNGQVNKPNLYIYFIENALKSLLNIDGFLCFINPIAFLVQSDCISIRKIILKKKIIELLDVSFINIFKSADTYTVILNIQNSNKVDNFKYHRYFNIDDINKLDKLNFPIKTINDDEFKIVLSEYINLISKINKTKNSIKNIADIICGTSAEGFGKEITFNKTTHTAPVLQASDIRKYKINWLGQYINKKLFNNKKKKIFNNNKIVMARMTDSIRCALDNNKYYCAKINVITAKDNNINTLYFLLAILNSKLVNFYYKEVYRALHKKGGALGFDIPSIEKIPIPLKTNDTSIIKYVDKIINITKQENYLFDKQAQEQVNKCQLEIDKIVYKLYNLTQEEIDVIEKSL